MFTKERTIPGIKPGYTGSGKTESPRSRPRQENVRHVRPLPPRRLRYLGLILTIYCFFALAAAGFQIFFMETTEHLLVSPVYLIAGLTAYTILKTWHPVRWYRSSAASLTLIAVDIAICGFLVMSTGGLESPFLLYTLSPVLRSALFLDQVVTSLVVLISAIAVVCAHLFNPLAHNPAEFTWSSWSYFIVYVTAACLSAALPYLINFNLRQRMLAEDIASERQRLSRELHDGSVQAFTALRWQAELINRRLTSMGIDMEEARQLVVLAEKSRQDALTTLDLLRCNKPDLSFTERIQESLKVLSPDIKTEFQPEKTPYYLEPAVEHELLRICQESITNIKKHSRAQHVRLEMKAVNSRLEIIINDDGAGFDVVSMYHDGFRTGGHGLAVMRERAELAGGQFRILSFPGKGTEIRVEVPTVSRLEGLWGM